MDPPTNHDPDLSAEELFNREQTALVDARAKVACSAYELTRLKKEYSETAALHPPASEYTVADLRTDELRNVLGRINVALDLTGEEQDYWVKLWEYALAKGIVAADEFDEMTREGLAAIIDAGLPIVDDNLMISVESHVERGDSRNTVVDQAAGESPSAPTQPRCRWARSRSAHGINIARRVVSMKKGGLSQLEMCERLDAQNIKPPDLVGWRHLTWRAAYRDKRHGGSVKKWLSKVTAVTS